MSSPQYILSHLTATDIPLIWQHINRREVIERMYRQTHGELHAYSCFYDVLGWDEQHLAEDPPTIRKAYQDGAICLGLWDAERLIAVSVIGAHPVTLYPQARLLSYFYVDADYRGQGIGADLMQATLASLKDLNATALYISAIPTCNTVDFYMRQGAKVLYQPDPTLFAAEPEDIHLLCTA
ncbi:GNAT family N-acetyltransferase [Acinetobacter larvae]|uniref:GNAT family N-acetyltransferase n=1 Tax=Acinetobacter larvae TaxID=1789224 RepID=A0A1B2LX58_9GAMM|nr:GNAT family N-acetyltransferase [Acinetobacter larvae]AOA57520.1 GNAT family N-acetyltransferase [Acinetobacter larvae]